MMGISGFISTALVHHHNLTKLFEIDIILDIKLKVCII